MKIIEQIENCIPYKPIVHMAAKVFFLKRKSTRASTWNTSNVSQHFEDKYRILNMTKKGPVWSSSSLTLSYSRHLIVPVTFHLIAVPWTCPHFTTSRPAHMLPPQPKTLPSPICPTQLRLWRCFFNDNCFLVTHRAPYPVWYTFKVA